MLPTQVLSLIVLLIFYGVYFGKMLMQRRRGIDTDQLGKGAKPARTLRIERLLRVASFAIVPVEVASVFLTPTAPVAAAVVGLSLAALGVFAFAAAIRAMKSSWRAGISGDDTTLVTGGIYRVSRNPAFLGFDLVYMGLLIANFNWLHLAFCAFAVVMMHLQILEEERYLTGAFGEAYTAYRQRAARYFWIL